MSGYQYWNADQKTRLTELWYAGKKAEEISKILEKEFGVSRKPNNIAAVATTMNLPRRSSSGPTRKLKPFKIASDKNNNLPQDLESPHPRGKMRKCLKCKESFFSEHAGIRFCNDHKPQSASSIDAFVHEF